MKLKNTVVITNSTKRMKRLTLIPLAVLKFIVYQFPRVQNTAVLARSAFMISTITWLYLLIRRCLHSGLQLVVTGDLSECCISTEEVEAFHISCFITADSSFTAASLVFSIRNSMSSSKDSSSCYWPVRLWVRLRGLCFFCSLATYLAVPLCRHCFCCWLLVARCGPLLRADWSMHHALGKLRVGQPATKPHHV